MDQKKNMPLNTHNNDIDSADKLSTMHQYEDMYLVNQSLRI